MMIAEEIDAQLNPHPAEKAGHVFVAMPISEFEREVLERLGQLQAKMDMLAGNGQPGRVFLLEQRLTCLEKNDVRRSVYDRILNAAIAVLVSAAIALHDHLGFK